MASGVGGSFNRMEGLGDAEPAAQAKPLVVNVDHHHLAGTGQRERGGHQDANRARPVNEHRPLKSETVACNPFMPPLIAIHQSDGHAERLGKYGQIVGKIVGQPDHSEPGNRQTRSAQQPSRWGSSALPSELP